MNRLDLPAVREAALDAHEPIYLDEARILDTLVHNLDGMAYRCLDDEHWSMLFVSQGCAELTGHSPRDLVRGSRVTWEALTHPEDRARVRSQIRQALTEGRRFQLQYRIVTRDGQIKWVQERGASVRDETGRPVMEGFVQDVSDQLRTLEALREAEYRYRQIFEHASEGMFQSSREGRYLAANQALARMYGYDSPEQLIADLSDIQHRLYVDESRREAFIRLMESQGKVTQFESEVLRRDGTRIWISESARAVRSPSGEFICYEGTVQDITERRGYEARLQRQANHDQLTGLPNRNLLRERLLQALTETITLQACAAARDWPEVDGRPIRLAINLSPKLFIDPHLVARLTGWLRQEGIQPHRVELEITESVFLDDPQRALRTLKAFKEKGFHLAMDDFGTGYSSLSYLRHFPLDTIKIDRSLVTDLEAQRDAAMIARAVVSLGLSLGKNVVAEGVEHDSQFSALCEQGCTGFQGYLFARPLTAADLLRRLHEGAGAC